MILLFYEYCFSEHNRLQRILLAFRMVDYLYNLFYIIIIIKD